jgi:hypothetical protein
MNFLQIFTLCLYFVIYVSSETTPETQRFFNFKMLELKNNLKEKYCNMRDFSGKPFCPISTTEKTSDKIPFNGIFSGYGFDRVLKEIRFPVLVPATKIVHEKKVFTTSVRYPDIRSFLNQVYKTGDQDFFEAGVYCLSVAGIRQLSNSFSVAHTNVGVSQKIYTSFTSQIEEMKALPEFNTIIEMLPPYDPKDPIVKEMYQTLIRFFGTDASTSTEHGGSIYQQTTIKECFGGDSVTGMRSDLERTIQKLPLISNAYTRYRSLSQINILGGNPELGSDKMEERIASFDVAPAPVKFYTVPLWEVIKNVERRNWIKAAVTDYIQANQPTVNRVMNEINHAKLESFKRPQNVYILSYSVEQNGLVLTWGMDCPFVRLGGDAQMYLPQCTRRRPTVQVAANQRMLLYNRFYGQELHVERDGSGQLRALVLENGNVIRASNPIVSGCERVGFGGRACLHGNCYNIFERNFIYVCMDTVPNAADGGPAHYNMRHSVPAWHCGEF